MTEPPAKRARRTDSSTMWDMNDSTPRGVDRGPKEVDGISKRDAASREDSRRSGDYRNTRDDGRRRSRSRERTDRRKERSRSRDRRGRGGREPRRDTDRDQNRDRDRDERDGRGGGERSAGRDRKYSRQGYAPRGGRHRERSHSRSRSRTRSPTRGGTKSRARSPPPTAKSDRREAGRDQRLHNDGKGPNGVLESKQQSEMEPMDIDDGDETAMERQMQKIMGFSAFRSTQNTKVPGNNVYGVRKEKKSEYRQYMNRVGGFNRPLSPSR